MEEVHCLVFFHDFQVLSTDVEACKGNAGYRLASRSGQSVSKDAAAAHVSRPTLKLKTFIILHELLPFQMLSKITNSSLDSSGIFTDIDVKKPTPARDGEFSNMYTIPFLPPNTTTLRGLKHLLLQRRDLLERSLDVSNTSELFPLRVVKDNHDISCCLLSVIEIWRCHFSRGNRYCVLLKHI